MSVNIKPGREVSLHVPGRKSLLRAKVKSFIEGTRTIVFIDPRNGNTRMADISAVKVVHRTVKGRR